jgi:hypothetical protein
LAWFLDPPAQAMAAPPTIWRFLAAHPKQQQIRRTLMDQKRLTWAELPRSVTVCNAMPPEPIRLQP